VLIGLPALLFRTGLADPAVAAAVMAAAFVIGAGFTLAALRRGRWYLAVGCMAAATLLGFTTLGARVMPSLDGELVTTGLRQELLKELKPGMQVALYREVMPSLTFYLDRVVPSIEAAGKDSSALRALELASKPGTLVLLRKTHLDDLKAALPELAQRHPELAREAERVLANPRIVMKGMNLNRASNTEFVVLGRSTSS